MVLHSNSKFDIVIEILKFRGTRADALCLLAVKTSFYRDTSLRAVPLHATSRNFLISLDQNSHLIISNKIVITSIFNGHTKCKKSRRRSLEQTWNLATLALAVKNHQKVVEKFPKINSDNSTVYCTATNWRKCARQSD